MQASGRAGAMPGDAPAAASASTGFRRSRVPAIIDRSFRRPVATAKGESVRNHDLQFLKHFSMVIGVLVAVTLVLLVFAHYVHGLHPVEQDPRAEARVVERIAPVGGVYAGETGAAAIAAAAQAAAALAASQVAYDGTLDGSVIFGQLCGACHTNGAGGAPTLDHSHWDARIAQGMDTMVKHAIEGYQGSAGLMPARGGNPSLNDAQVEATVKWMIDNLK